MRPFPDDERLCLGLLDEVPPFTLPPDDRLFAFASRGRYDWMNDPRAGERARLLAQLEAGGAEEPVEGDTTDLWHCLFAVMRADRFDEGALDRHALALVRIANELRRRLGEGVRTGTHPPHEVRSTDTTVQASSHLRLPFEGPAWKRLFCERLTSRVRAMQPLAGHLLSGVYTAEPEEAAHRADTENVLFYNVGTSAFAALSRTGVRFERCYEPDEIDDHHVFPLRHHHRYEQLPLGTPFRHWQVSETLARWREISLPALASSTRPAVVWWALRTGQLDAGGVLGREQPFGVRVRVDGFEGRPLVGVMKPLLDGIIAAFHPWAGERDGEVTARLSTQLEAPEQDVARRLFDTPSAVLPARRVAHAHREGVAWAPLDDLCLAAEVTAGTPEGPLRVSGELFSVAACVPD